MAFMDDKPFDPKDYPEGDLCKGCNSKKRIVYRCEDCEVGLDFDEHD